MWLWLWIALWDKSSPENEDPTWVAIWASLLCALGASAAKCMWLRASPSLKRDECQVKDKAIYTLCTLFFICWFSLIFFLFGSTVVQRLALLLHSKKLLGLNLLPCFLRGVCMFSPCLGSVWALWFPMMFFHIRRAMHCALKSILFCCLCYTEKVSPLCQAKRNTSTSQGGLVCAVVNLVAWCEVHSYNQQECRITGSGHILYTGKKLYITGREQQAAQHRF